MAYFDPIQEIPGFFCRRLEYGNGSATVDNRQDRYVVPLESLESVEMRVWS